MRGKRLTGVSFVFGICGQVEYAAGTNREQQRVERAKANRQRAIQEIVKSTVLLTPSGPQDFETMSNMYRKVSVFRRAGAKFPGAISVFVGKHRRSSNC